MNKEKWRKVVTQLIKVEMLLKEINSTQLSEMLKDLGVNIKAQDLRVRFSRGNFSAVLFIQCLKAMNVKTLDLQKIDFSE